MGHGEMTQRGSIDFTHPLEAYTLELPNALRSESRSAFPLSRHYNICKCEEQHERPGADL